MIIIERTITVKNDQAVLDNPLYLYVGDGSITCIFTINEIKKVTKFGSISPTNLIEENENTDYGEIRIYKPDQELVFTKRAEIIDGKLVAEISFEHMDETDEAGLHQLQIHLYDAFSGERNRFTIPPVELHVLHPIGTDTTMIDQATTGIATLDDRDIPEETFLEDGSYNKTEWQTGDIITKNKLNKIEDAIYQLDERTDGLVSEEELDIALSSKADKEELDNKADIDHTHSASSLGLARVAATGSYNDLSNTPNFVTASQLSGYATVTQLNNKADKNHNHPEYATAQSLTAYAKITDIPTVPTVPTKTSQLTNDSNFATNDKIPTRTSQLTNDSNFISSIPSYYITDTELSEYNYISKGEVSANYPTYDDMTSAINQAQWEGGSGDGSGIDLTIYATKTDLAGKANINHTHNEYITNEELDNMNYATEEYVIDTIDERIGDYDFNIDLSNYPTISDMDNALLNKADKNHNHDDTYATIQYVDEQIGSIDIEDIDLSAYATKEELGGKADTGHNHDDMYYTEAQVDVKFTILQNAMNDKAALDHNHDDIYATKSEVPTNVSDLANDAGYIASGKDSSGNYFITRIEIVTELPEEEIPGVLYIVKE